MENSQPLFETLHQWTLSLLADMPTMDNVVAQVGVATLLFIASAAVSNLVRQGTETLTGRWPSQHWLILPLQVISRVSYQLVSITLFSLYAAVAITFEFPHQVADIVIALLTAWLIIAATSKISGGGLAIKIVANLVLALLLLHLAGVLETIIHFFDTIRFTFGSSQVSLFAVFKGFVLMLVLLLGANTLSSRLENYFHTVEDVSASYRALLAKLVKIGLVTLAILIGLNASGLDLSAFAFLGGAIGVGLGFGLQKVVSNFVSGIILLTDRSIKPGDVIAIGETYGWVNALGARYVSVITRDNKEHLIPNEQLITEKVENWSFTDKKVRVRIPIGISYDADPHKAREIMLESVRQIPRVLDDPVPKCLMREFADSTINMELRVWIEDPYNGMGNIQSDILFKVWDAFKEHGIEIPFPQRDIHIKSMPEKGAKHISDGGV